MFLGKFRSRLNNLSIPELRLKVDKYLPNLNLRVKEALGCDFRNTLPLDYFTFKVPLWLSFIKPRSTKFMVFMAKNPHLSSAENYFQRHAEYKDFFLDLTKFERKALKWEAKLTLLLNRKRCGIKLTGVLNDALAKNSRVS